MYINTDTLYVKRNMTTIIAPTPCMCDKLHACHPTSVIPHAVPCGCEQCIKPSYMDEAINIDNDYDYETDYSSDLDDAEELCRDCIDKGCSVREDDGTYKCQIWHVVDGKRMPYENLPHATDCFCDTCEEQCIIDCANDSEYEPKYNNFCIECNEKERLLNCE